MQSCQTPFSRSNYEAGPIAGKSVFLRSVQKGLETFFILDYTLGMEKAADCAKDVSVISCDQFFTAEYMVPRLTSVDQHNALFGQFVIKALLSAMEGGRENVLLRYDPELIIRESCMPPAQKENKENQTE